MLLLVKTTHNFIHFHNEPVTLRMWTQQNIFTMLLVTVTDVTSVCINLILD